MAAVTMGALAACSSTSAPSTSPSDASTTSSAPNVTGAPSASSAAVAPGADIDRWKRAYSYLSAQTKPTEIACLWLSNAGGRTAQAPQPAQFYDFSDTARWKDHLITRDDPLPLGTFQICEATVPTSVRYGPEIEVFLRRYGLAFGTKPDPASGLTSIEIAYAGQSASDPDIIYRDKPGLFGLRIALAQLGASPFAPGTSKIAQPSDAATARRYLQYATPLLTWYGYKP